MFVNTFVWSVLSYGSDSWTVEKQEKDRLEATVMCMQRKVTNKLDRQEWNEIKEKMPNPSAVFR